MYNMVCFYVIKKVIKQHCRVETIHAYGNAQYEEKTAVPRSIYITCVLTVIFN